MRLPIRDEMHHWTRWFAWFPVEIDGERVVGEMVWRRFDAKRSHLSIIAPIHVYEYALKRPAE